MDLKLARSMLGRLAQTKTALPPEGALKKGALIPRFPGADILPFWENAWDELHNLTTLCTRLMDRGNLSPEQGAILDALKKSLEDNIATMFRVSQEYQEHYTRVSAQFRGIINQVGMLKTPTRMDLVEAGLDRKQLQALMKVWDQIN